MPSICKYGNCRSRPKLGIQYCSTHCENTISQSNFMKCIEPKCNANYGTKNFKGYCSDCYIRLFEDDPLTFQTKCKTKEIAIAEFIHCYFDGFSHSRPIWFGTVRIDNRIQINDTTLCVDITKDQNPIQIDTSVHVGKFIFIRFNSGKYKEYGKSYNPMIYTRLPLLEKEINHQINRVLQKENVEIIETFELFFDLVKVNC